MIDEMNLPPTAITIHDATVGTAGGRLAVRTWTPDAPQRGLPVVLFHDSLGCIDLWRSFPAALAARTGRPVIAYDRLGFGRSDPHAGELHPAFVGEEAGAGFAALRRQLGIGRFIALGHSVGGGMAVHCAAQFGDACAALVTESAQAFVEDRTVQGIAEARDLFRDAAQFARLRKYHGDKAEWVLNAWVDSWLSPAFASWSLRAVLPQVQCPVLAIHGAEDEYGSERHPALIAALAGGPVQLAIMADTRHVPHREKESLVVDRIAGFLQPID